MESRYYALHITDQNGSRYVGLNPDQRWWVLGRSAQCQVTIKDRYISRRHCTLLHLPVGIDEDNRVWVLQDGDRAGTPSQNGTFVELTPIHSQPIELGTTFSLGPNVLVTLTTVEHSNTLTSSRPFDVFDNEETEAAPRQERLNSVA